MIVTPDFADEYTGAMKSLSLLWFLSNVANSVETNVLHTTIPLQELPYIKFFFKCMHCITLML